MSAVFITGCNRGIGLALARLYAREGWTVHATVRNPEQAGSIEALGDQVFCHTLDVSDSGNIRSLAKKLEGTAIDVLISNAGIYGKKLPLGSLEREEWLNVLSTNSISPLLLAQAFLPHVKASHTKKLIAVSSKMGSIGDNSSGGSYIYRSSKAALNAAWVSLAHDLKKEGVIASILHPGWVRTDMGGPNALISTEESAIGLKEVIQGLDLGGSGKFLDYAGKDIPW